MNSVSPEIIISQIIEFRRPPENSDCLENLTVVDFEFVKTRLESKFSNGHFVITSILQCWIENIKSDDDVT